MKRKPGRTRPNSDEAGATPPFDAPCVTASVGSLPPQSRAARDPFGRVPEPEFRSCKTTSITPREGERKDTDQSTKTTQDGNLPRFMMSRASNESWTGMGNSVVILVSLTVAPSWLRKFPEKTNFLIEVFPFRGLLIGMGFDSFREPRSLFAVREGERGMRRSDCMKPLDGTSKRAGPRKKMANHKDSR
jgi:hypothetical protein